jgi:peroxiredoxin
MKRLVTGSGLVLLVLALFAGQVLAQTPFRDLEGNPRSISDYAGGGKWLVVKIWAHGCHVCNMEAENYAYFHEKHQDADARVLGISMDGVAELAQARAYVERHDITFPNLIGEPGAVMQHYVELTGQNFLGTPTILLYEPSGKLVAAQAGGVPTEVIERFMASHAGGG